MVLPLRIELRTSPLPMECSTTELRQPRMAANIRSLARCRAVRSGLMNAGSRPIDTGMASGEKGQKGGQAGGRKGDAARAARLRAALRENLKRRKAQARERSLGRTEVRGGAPHDSAGFVPDKSED